ncbi:hypothetical protein M409DRAFT_67797 [Zasmidium cellare ATCC 36951]|uniref:Stealth protein CR3 conserved region 3 domain-containing protein n=1 Tax=Zasmidium cellare ATCC 36951 TaxID=1080233 RepID=A0A6A6CG96_ZASCE|nr:uncharacterized protein M409DRAFT_67797 [Zasmidium cellare ATCC 36951]KAF2164689.1 hypothetical protein M409DRAFT_67797 [Zasmidium cellare ATCC 36951]
MADQVLDRSNRTLHERNVIPPGILPEIQDDSTHRVFRSSKAAPASHELMHIKAYQAMSDECVEEWIVHHVWGPACSGTDLSQGLTIDGVWAWVNGSDPLQIAWRNRYRPNDGMTMDATHRYTEHNELRYSMRSALASLGNRTMRRLHILASAYGLPDAVDADMAGQVPAWLDKEVAATDAGSIKLHHDVDFFAPSEAGQTNLSELETWKWRKSVIPSFNSLAVESQIYNIDNTASDQLVYYNDDFFTLRKLFASDFTTPLFGPVIRTLTRVTSMYLPAENTIYRWIHPTGEEYGIKRAAWVLGRRFGSRPYYYITHHPRTLSLPLLHEAAQTFPDAFSNTAKSRFRAQRDVPPPVQAIFLGSWYIVERHREALLWTWAVAKWGGTQGVLTASLKRLMLTELADEPWSSGTSLKIGVPIRVPIEKTNVFQQSNIDVPSSTEYSFSSKDGYALSYVESMWFWDRPRHGYPDLAKGLIEDPDKIESGTQTRFLKSPSHKPAKMCTIVLSTCFGSMVAEETASEFFKRVAFKHPKCGDCIIAALIGASGVTGIHKFLPQDHSESASKIHAGLDAVPPHLPLTSDWRTTNFSISHVIPDGSLVPSTNLRTWCARLIQRYSYVLGSTSSDFYKVERAGPLLSKTNEIRRMAEKDTPSSSLHPDHGVEELPSLEQNDSSAQRPGSRGSWEYEMGEHRGPLAFLCLNDDIKETGDGRDRVDQIYVEFFEDMWPETMSFEQLP